MTDVREFLKNPHFARYYNTWQKNERSLVFIPLAEFFRSKGLYDEALAICEKGLSFNAQSVTGRLALARIYSDLGKRHEAVDLLKDILQDLPGQQDALLLLAKFRIAEPESGESVSGPNDIGEVALEIPPDTLTPWDTCTMAQIYARQGEYRKALGIVEKILTLDPSHDRAKQLREEFIKCKSSSSMAQI